MSPPGRTAFQLLLGMSETPQDRFVSENIFLKHTYINSYLKIKKKYKL